MSDIAPTTQPNLILDLSPRVVELARIIDHLPPGTFEITIQKSDVIAQTWQVEIVRTEIVRTEKIQTLKLSKYKDE
jgi:hypothetical protein